MAANSKPPPPAPKDVPAEKTADKPGPPVENERLVGKDDLDAIDRFGPVEAKSQSTVVASVPIFLDDDGPQLLKEKGATISSTQIAPLPQNVSAMIEFVGAGDLRFAVTKTVTVIGRISGAADLVLPWNEEASRQHCAILYAYGAFFLEDLQSSNGTFVNEQPAERTRLRTGDQIRIGSQVLVFRFRVG